MAEFLSVSKDIFFDAQKIIDAMDRKTARVLSATGAFGRTVMKLGMRRRKGVSDPDDYPSAHVGLLRDLIYFGYDMNTKSLVVGPLLFATPGKGLEESSSTLPQLINEGGRARIGERRKNGTVRWREATYTPRPFVALTQEETVPKFIENMEKFEYR